MQFKLWLEHSAGTHSWLASNGVFHPVWGISHQDWAQRYFAKSGDSMMNAMNALFSKGWLRVTSIGRALVTHNPYKQLNGLQKQALIDLAITDKFDSIEYSDDEDERTIWASDDQL